MTEREVLDSLSKAISIPTTKYKGDILKNQRHGIGKEIWNFEESWNYQNYQGKFIYDSLHGLGNYAWKIDNEQTNYEGLFYSSKLEGYGKMSNNNNSYFEGLFRQNSRFGPGVFTNADGTQDVGVWYGKNLMRLCLTVNPEWVPRIARSAKAKVHLLKYKILVKICNEVVDYGKEVLESIGANNNVINDSKTLHNIFVRNPKSIFFNKVLYEKEYFNSNDCYIELTDNSDIFEHEVVTMNSSDICIKANNTDSDHSLIRMRIQDLVNELDLINQDLLIVEELYVATLGKAGLDEYSLGIVSYGEREKKNVYWEVNHPNGSLITDEFLEFESNDFDLEYLEAEKSLRTALNALKLLNLKKTNILKKIEYEESESQKPLYIKSKQPPKKVLVTDLLAWNNEETSIEMMKYAFLHRNFEKNMSFCVAKLLCGDRSEFRQCGKYETDCVAFLTLCSNGDFNSVSNLLIQYDLNPDICDARGNTGMMFAAARDRHKTIRTLINYGGNVDVFNDECLTPLSLCILRYLATQNQITDWESAFLHPNSSKEEPNFQQWRPNTVFTNTDDNVLGKQLPIFGNIQTANQSSLKLETMSETVSSNADIFSTDFSVSSLQLKLRNMITKDLQEMYVDTNNVDNQSYLFNLDCVHPIPIKMEKTKAKKEVNKNQKKNKNNEDKIEKDVEKLDLLPAETLLHDKLRVINETILLLLSFGADPNISEVPMPLLLTSLFTKNVQLVKSLLLNNAHPNVRTTEDGLTGFHILVSLPPCNEILDEIKVLFEYGGDPNITASVQHWTKEKYEVLGEHTLQEDDDGKTPLHLLAMRYDFESDLNGNFNEIAKLLIENGCLANKLYLGHTALSLATLRGNCMLVQALLETGKVNPNCLLGEEMGVPLTIGTLKRYHSLPCLNTYEKIVQTLVQFGANPLNSTGIRGNVIEFICKENELIKNEFSKKNVEKKKKLKTQVSKKEKQYHVQNEINLLLYKVTSEILEKHLKGSALMYLYQHPNYSTERAEQTAKFVNVAESISIMQSLFYRGEIPIEPSNFKRLYGLIEFVVKVNYPSTDGDKVISNNVDINQLLENFEFKKLPPKEGYLNLPLPEVDKKCEKYKICFNCYRKLNCELFQCPKCQLIYFCSEKCNVLSNNRKSIHKCNTNFYAEEAKIDKERTQDLFFSNNKIGQSHLEKIKNYKQLSAKTLNESNQQIQLGLTKQLKHNVHNDEAIHLSTSEKKHTTKKLKGQIQSDHELQGHFNKKKQKHQAESNQKDKSVSIRQKHLHLIKKGRSRTQPHEQSEPTIKNIKNKIATKRNTNLTNDQLLKAKCEEYKKRLPKKYQCFLEKIVEFWPDLDLSMLFLPYACFSNGQLYYRFDLIDPIFAETYSII